MTKTQRDQLRDIQAVAIDRLHTIMCQHLGDPPEAQADLADPKVRREVYALRAAVRSVESAFAAEAALVAIDKAKPGSASTARVS